MARVEFPATLPHPVEISTDPAERRRLSDIPGALQTATKWRDFGATQALRWVFSRTEVETFKAWLTDELHDGGAWFSANWRQPSGLAYGVRRFTSPPTYTQSSETGAGLWTVQATVEIRGVPGVTSDLPLVYTGTVLYDVPIPKTLSAGDWASVCDIYIPDDVTPDNVSIWLHGGKGSKETFARNLGIVTGKDDLGDPIIKWELMFKNKTIAVVPMGQYADGTFDALWNPNSADTTLGGTKPGVRTWSNGFMYSGQNDPQMLEDLATMLDGLYSLPVHLAGHSNGGFMVQRMWQERPTLFSRMACASGPMSAVYLGDAPPAVVRPMFSLIGGKDTTLSVSGGPEGAGNHFFDNTWTQPSTGYSVANVQLPPPGYYIGEHGQWVRRVAAWETYTAATHDMKSKRAKVKVGYTTTYYTQDFMQILQLVEEAGHFILGRPDLGGPSMQQCLGRRFFSLAMWFFRQ